MFELVDESGYFWRLQRDRPESCLTDSTRGPTAFGHAFARKLAEERGVKTDALRKTRRVLGEKGYAAMLWSKDAEAAIGVIRNSVERFDAAAWELPRLQTPAQPNDYLILASTLESWRGPKGKKTRDRLAEIFASHYADIVEVINRFLARRPFYRESFDDQIFRANHGFDPDSASSDDPFHALVRRRNLRACVAMIREIQADKLLERY